MRFKTCITLLGLWAVQSIAVTTVNTLSTNPGVLYLEDSLKFQIESSSNLPSMIQWQWSNECSTGVESKAESVIEGSLAFTHGVRSFLWTLPPGTLPGGHVCIKAQDRVADTSLGTALALTIYSQSRPKVTQISSQYPWTVMWERSPYVPWNRIQLIERDSGSLASEVILDDFYTQDFQWSPGIESSAWMNPAKRHWVRIANAFAQWESAVQRDSWITASLSIHMDTLPKVQLRTPLQNASLLRDESGSQISFLWTPLSTPCRYQIQLARLVHNRWVTERTGETSDSSWSTPIGSLAGGQWRWTVTAIQSNLIRSQAQARQFTLDEIREIRTITLVRTSDLGQTPILGAKVTVQTWDGYAAQSATTASSGTLIGKIQILAAPGPALIQVEENGKAIVQFNVNILSTDSTLTWLLPQSPQAMIQGQIIQMNGIPLANYEVYAHNTHLDTIRSRTNTDGYFNIHLESGIWWWNLPALNGPPLDSVRVILQEGESRNLGQRIINQKFVDLSVQILSSSGLGVAKSAAQIYSMNGTLFSQKITDAHGRLTLAIPKGRWIISIQSPDLRSIRDTLDVQGTLYKTYRLNSGALQVQGSVRIIEEAVIGTRLEQVASGIQVKCWPLSNAEATLSTSTDLNGEFEFSLPQGGSWLVQASYLNRKSNLDTLNFQGSESTLQLSLRITLEALIEGQVQAINLQADSIPVHLWKNDSLVATTWAKSDGLDTWSYLFRNISAGQYRLESASQGWRMSDSVFVEVLFLGSFIGRGTVSADPILLTSHTQQFAIYSLMQSNTLQRIPAHWEQLYPQRIVHQTPDTIDMGPGLLSYRVIPDSSGWIPLWKQDLLMDTNSWTSDSVVFPAFHPKPNRVTLTDAMDSLEFFLDLYSPIESVYLWVIDPVTKAARRVDHSSINEERATFAWAPGSYSSQVSYWFEVVSEQGLRTFSNPPPFHHFTRTINFDAAPFELQSSHPDTLLTVSGSQFTIQLSATTLANGLSYSSELIQQGQILWTSSHAQSIRVVPLANSLAARVDVVNSGSAQIQCIAQIGNYRDTLQIQIQSQQSDSVRGAYQVHVSGPSLISGGQSLAFSARMMDSIGQEWLIPSVWRAEPPQAVRAWQNDSIVIDSQFIGPLLLIGSSMNYLDTAWIDVVGLVQGDAPAKRWIHDSTVSVYLSDSSWSGPSTRVVRLHKFAGKHRLRNALDSVESKTHFFNSSFDQGYPLKSPYLEFRLPSSVDRFTPWVMDSTNQMATPIISRTMRKIQSTQPDTLAMDTLQYEDESWLRLPLLRQLPWYYALVGEADSKVQASLNIVPNPFSPYVIARVDGNTEAGTSIRYYPFVPGYSTLIVQIQILNLSGEPVRMLVLSQSMPTIPQRIQWNGLDDNGMMVRNGRYLVLLTLKSSARGKILKKLIKPVVVFK